MTRLFLGAGAAALLLFAFGTYQLPLASAQEPKSKTKTIKIRWYGQSFFQVEDADGRTFAFDPHAIPAFGRVMVRADFVCVSHPHDDHAMIEMIDIGKPDKRIAENDVYRGVIETKTGKQEWKTIDEKRGNIRIRNIATYHDTMNGLQRGKNSIFIINVDGIVICHLGDLGHELTPEQVKAIGKVDVLMVPIGGIYTINGEQAQKVMKQLKPRLYVLPMHYGVPGYDDLAGPEEFLEDVPKDQLQKLLNTNELSFPTDAKPEKPTIVILSWKKAELPPPKK